MLGKKAKKLLLLVGLGIAATGAKAQQTEFTVSANSGVFSFAGPSATKVSFISAYSWDPGHGYTNTPYGSNPGLAYGLSGQAQRLTKAKLLFGAGLGYEALRSEVEVTQVFGTNGNLMEAATGKTNLTYQFLNLNPYFGRRFFLNCLAFDFTAGFDVAIPIKNGKEKGEATTHTGHTVKVSEILFKPGTDVRPRLQLTTYYKKTGIYLGYSFGQANYLEGWVGGVNEAHVRIVRFGLTYKI